MRKLGSGTNFARYALGDITVVALRDGFVDMPPSRLRQPGDRPFGADMPAQVELVDGRLGCRSMRSWSSITASTS